MIDTTGQHQWPEEEEPRPRRPKRGVLAWIGRLIGDAGLTIGMGRSLEGPQGDREAIYNVMLRGEGDAKGREADRDAGED